MTHTNAPVQPDHSQSRRELALAELTGPLRAFLQTESGSAGLLLAATLFALAWANSPWSDAYVSLWETKGTISIGDWSIAMDLKHWMNDGFMVIFFFVVGLELRHEISIGDMRQRRSLVIPALGGIGGLIVPALLFLLVNPSGDESHGWGVVIGTDTAFLLGALALVGPKGATQLRVFLLTMTIVDDLLAVAVIGLVYSESLNLVALGIGAGFLAVIGLLGRFGAWQNIGYLVAGIGAWIAGIESGLHPSIFGMLAGLLVVAHPPRRDAIERAAALFRAFRQSPLPGLGVTAKQGIQRAVSPNERFQAMLHPWTSYLIVPVFAMANAGVDLRGGEFGDALQSPLTWGVVLGLVAGKLIGIAAATLGGSWLGAGPLPRGVSRGELLGGAALSGLGFSVSLLIVDLAFDSPQLQEQATIGVLLACVFSIVTGGLTFRLGRFVFGEQRPRRLMALDPPVDPKRDHIRGRPDAPLTLVEYLDFECPFCSSSTHVIEELRERFGDELRYVARHLPLADIHPHAELAAEAAEAAGEQGRFWEMFDLLFQHQDRLEWEDLIGYAAALGLDLDQFTTALTESRYAARVRADAVSAEASGARRTPTFFVGDRRHLGPWDTETLTAALEELRERQKSAGARGRRAPEATLALPETNPPV